MPRAKRSASPPHRKRRSRSTPATSATSWMSSATARSRLQGGFAFAVVDDRAEASFHAPEALAADASPSALRPPIQNSKPFDLFGESYVLGRAHVGDHGQILVAMPLPANYSGTLRDLENSQNNITICDCSGAVCVAPISDCLLLLTVGVLFASMWLALYLSKMVTRAAGRAGRSYARDLPRPPRLPCRRSGGQRDRSAGGLVQPHGGRPGSEPRQHRSFAPQTWPTSTPSWSSARGISRPFWRASLRACSRSTQPAASFTSNAAVRRLLHLDQRSGSFRRESA